MALATPSADDIEELLLSCRYGDLDDIRQFVDRFGPDPLASARDENGNSVLHMAAGNGHTDALDFLLPLVPASLLAAPNAARSTPLHWAALNQQLAVAQRLVRFPGGPGVGLIDAKNAAGRSPLGEAENAGWDEGARWFVEVMHLEDAAAQPGEEEDAAVDPAENVEIEIQDAEGQVAKMTLGPREKLEEGPARS